MRANRPKNSNSEGSAGRFETCPYNSIFRPDSHPGVPARPDRNRESRHRRVTAKIAIALIVVSSLWACGGDSVTTPGQPSFERGLHEVGTMTRPRDQHVATLLGNGKVLIAGGYKERVPDFFNDSNRHISAELFDPETGTTSPTGDMALGRNTDFGLLLPDSRVLIMPRYHDFPVEIYDPHSARFEVLAKIPWFPPIATANLLQSGKVFVTNLEHTAVFDPAAGSFASIVAMEKRRTGHTATLLKDGRVLIVGGSTGLNYELAGQNLIYDPSANAFTEAGHLKVDRWGHIAVLLQDGRVLIVSGHTGSEPVNAAEMYDPETNTFSGAGTSAIRPSAALLLPSGRVFFIHGPTGNIVLYNPATHVFSPAGHSVGPSLGMPTVTLLADGRVMIAGGLTYKDDSTQDGNPEGSGREITDQILIFTP